MGNSAWIMDCESCCTLDERVRVDLDTEAMVNTVGLGGIHSQKALVQSVNYADGGSVVTTWDSKHISKNVSSDNLVVDSVPNTVTIEPTTGDDTIAYSDFYTYQQVRNEGYDALVGAIDWDNPDLVPVSGMPTIYDKDLISIDGGVRIIRALSFSRYRFQVDESHNGAYLKIRYDIVRAEKINGGIASTIDDIVGFESQDLEVEWTGPGDKLNPNDESWFTPWIDGVDFMNPPYNLAEGTEKSIRWAVVNVRTQRYPDAHFFSDITSQKWQPPSS